MSGIANFRVGQTEPAANWMFTDEVGRAVSFAAGTTYTMYIENSATNISIAGTGTFDTTNQTSGQLLYSWGTSDSATAGSFNVYIGYVTPAGKQGYSKVVTWTVQPIYFQN
jgi:hypothetical protein